MMSNLTYEWFNADHTTLRLISDGVTSFIPALPEVSAYQAFLKWCEEGNSPKPYVTPTPVDGISDLAEAKEIASKVVRAEAYSLLQPTDWVVVREAETGVAPSAEITTYRAAVRTAAESKISTIESKGKLSTLQTYLRSNEFATWPEAPTA